MSRGSERILYFLVVDEYGYEFSFTKGRGLIVDENGYVRGRKRVLYLMVVEEKGYALIPHAIMSIVTSFNETPASVN
jgi:hypothetical protein